MLLALITWHAGSVAPGTGIDDSWAVALNLAAARGLDFGHEVVFTYGPLGFLSEPVLASKAAGGVAWAYALVAQIAIAVVVLLAATRLYGRWIGIVAAFGALGLTLLVSDALVYLALFAAVLALERDDVPGARWLVPVAGLVAAFELLVKLNGGILCLVVFALVAWRLGPRGWRSELVLGGSFVVSLVVLWLVTRNSLTALPTWLKESWYVVGSYTDAMALPGSGRTADTVLAILLVLAGAGLLALHARTLPRARAICLVLVAAAFTYAYLKEGFVRYDRTHPERFFGAFAIAGLAFGWRGRLRWGALGLVAGCVLAIAVAPGGSAYRVDRNVGHFASLFHPNLAQARADAQARLGIPARFVASVRDWSVDVVPYETSAIWAYGLHWQPEPLLQWYMAYDARLDAFNAARVNAVSVLVQRTTVASDAKFPAFEAPATYVALLCRYREAQADASWELLGRVPDRCGRERLIERLHVGANETVTVPTANTNELVVAHVHMHASQVLSTLAKPFSFPHIAIGGNRYRLVAETATGPLVMREPAAAGRSPFFGGFTSYDSFVLSRAATVEFDAIPLARQPAAEMAPTPSVAGDVTGSTVRVGSKRYTLDPKAFQGWVDVARPANGLGALAGWAVDARDRPAPLVVAVAGGRASVAEPAEARPDVADGLHAKTAVASGYHLYVTPPLQHVRVFAVGGGKATELNYPADYVWR